MAWKKYAKPLVRHGVSTAGPSVFFSKNGRVTVNTQVTARLGMKPKDTRRFDFYVDPECLRIAILFVHDGVHELVAKKDGARLAIASQALKDAGVTFVAPGRYPLVPNLGDAPAGSLVAQLQGRPPVSPVQAAASDEWAKEIAAEHDGFPADLGQRTVAEMQGGAVVKESLTVPAVDVPPAKDPVPDLPDGGSDKHVRGLAAAAAAKVGKDLPIQLDRVAEAVRVRAKGIKGHDFMRLFGLSGPMMGAANRALEPAIATYKALARPEAKERFLTLLVAEVKARRTA